MTRPNASPQWRKSSHSTDTGGECVEVAELRPAVGIRDSKDPNGPMLLVSATHWKALTRHIKHGQHDLT
ncbi:DUF397 domain-containing protein [Actinomadura viridis]|uniref:DUF397 domain-containing protein n=1 Tax=Actinomadura viridis TaxID=58110 RepID=UPI0036AD7942